MEGFRETQPGRTPEKDKVVELKKEVNERGETVYVPASEGEARQAEELRRREELIQEKIKQLPYPWRGWVEDPRLRKVMISDETLLESTPEELVDMFEYAFEDVRRAFRERPELIDKLLEPIKEEMDRRAVRRQKPLEGGEKRALK